MYETDFQKIFVEQLAYLGLALTSFGKPSPDRSTYRQIREFAQELARCSDVPDSAELLRAHPKEAWSLAWFCLRLHDQINADEHTEAELTEPVSSSKNPFHVLCQTAQNFLDAMERECPEVLDS